jgi:endonuclease/exonuclease/phosphatase family metal-dependent hydrolase
VELGTWLSLILLLLPGRAGAATGRADDCQHFFRALGEAVQVEELPAGPRLRLPALAEARKLEDFNELRFGAYNVLNLQSSVGKYEWQNGEFVRVLDPRVKPEWAREAVAREILGKDPDFLFLEEVEGFVPLAEFNRQYLGQAYRPLTLRGNDQRGIEIAMLIKKDFPFDIEVLSHANVKHRDPRTKATEPLFSRDAPLVLLRRKGAPETERPLLALLGTHLKSQRDAPGDPGSVLMRTSQARGVLKILEDLQKKYRDMPLIMAGDFNTDVRTAPEMKPFWNAGMADSFALGARPIPEKFRVTQTFHPKPDRDGPELPAVKGQLDAMILNKAAVDLGIVNDTRIVVHRNEAGEARRLPETFHERSQNPSDHFMVFGLFDFAKLRDFWKTKLSNP